MTDVNRLLHKETNPLNTAAKNYGSKYVLTAEEWIRAIMAILENLNSIKSISFGESILQPDELGLVTIPFDYLKELLNLAGYLTKHLDISGLASKDSVDDAITNLENNLVAYIKENYLPKGDYSLGDSYLTLEEFTSLLRNYSKKADCDDALATGLETLESNLMQWTKDNYQPKGDYLTEHLSLADYAKKSDLVTKNILDKLQEKTQEEINQDNLDKLELLEGQIKDNANNINTVRSLVPEAVTTILFNQMEKESGKMYLVYRLDGTLSRVYIGTTLIAKKKQNNGFLGFPYNFPIVF